MPEQETNDLTVKDLIVIAVVVVVILIFCLGYRACRIFSDFFLASGSS